jgi:ribA/ribD-fused uncharacterized protein
MTREELAERTAADERFEFVFFWRHTPVGPEIDRRCLSQWSPHGFVVGDTTYATAEHFMMAEKARIFGDEEVRQQILRATTPKTVKALGRKVRNFDEATWREQRFDVVLRGSKAKFSSDAKLREYLLSTASAVLVEASPLDRVWGIGVAEDHADATHPSKWRGLNLLGFALMEARAQLAS